MSQKIPLYIPVFINSATYTPARVLPRLYFYNGQVNCENWYISDGNNSSRIQSAFPYFDHYNVPSGSQFPTTNSRSLLFNNENAVYGQIPDNSLYTTYWEKYIEFLYNPKTRVLNCQAIIPLADYFHMELNDIVNFRGNYWHLRAINDYSLKTGECNLQLVGPVIPDVFDRVPSIPTPPVQASSSVSWSYTESGQDGQFKVYDNATTLATLTADGNGNTQVSQSHYVTASLVPVSYPSSGSVVMSINVNGGTTLAVTASTNTTISASFLVGAGQTYKITGSIVYTAPVDPDLKVFLDAGNAASYPGSGTTWYDLTSNGNNVTLTGSPTYNAITGSFEFIGNTKYASTTSATNLSAGTGGQTTILWTRYTGPTNDETYYYPYENGYNALGGQYTNRMLFGDGGFGYGFEMAYGGSGLQFYVPAYNGTHDYTKSNMQNVWKQCVMVRDGDTIYYYINGSLVTSRTGFNSVSIDTSNSLYVGYCRSFAAGYYGDISMFSIYNRVLTGTEITNNFNTYKARYGY